MHFGGLELKFEKVATLFKANRKDKLAKDLDTYDDVMQGFKVLLYISLNTKTLQWIGEEEWRFGIPKIQAESNVVPFDFAESLYLGENIEEEWKEKLLEIAKEQGLLVYQRKLDSTKSKWIYEKFY